MGALALRGGDTFRRPIVPRFHGDDQAPVLGPGGPYQSSRRLLYSGAMSDAIDRLLDLMRRLRDPLAGCPWDREQTPASLVRHTLEEAYEVADCIEREDWDELPGELGDLLFQVVFYAQIGAESGRYDFETVVTGLLDKLTRRHPHVFGGEAVRDAADQAARWEAIKAAERAARPRAGVSALDGVPLGLPALVRAQKLQSRAAGRGFDWRELAPVLAKVHEELHELEQAIAEGEQGAVAHELGDLLFSCVNVARHLGLDAEAALRAGSTRFTRRFEAVERAAAAAGHALEALPPDELDRLWEEAKRAGP